MTQTPAAIFGRIGQELSIETVMRDSPAPTEVLMRSSGAKPVAGVTAGIDVVRSNSTAPFGDARRRS